jgi:hypothetical protein
MVWEGNTYEDELQALKKDGKFPPCLAGLTYAAVYDLRQLIQYAFARIREERMGERVAHRVVIRISGEHSERRQEKYLKPWAQQEANLRFLQWLICEELGRERKPSATTANIQADVIDYLTMELTGQEFTAPKYVCA